jgi:predicted phosphodiesterase
MEKRRKPEDLVNLTSSPFLGRLAVSNHYKKKVVELSSTSAFPALSAFLPSNMRPWISSYLRFAFTPKYKFQDYVGKDKNGVYALAPAGSDSVTLAIAGDWATGTEESAEIARLMALKNPEWTIHLGDVYYVGDESEVQENCLGVSAHGFTGVKWPHGSLGSFALNGNHEMYANGKAYFTTFLKTLGLEGETEGQLASFFCLEGDRWRIIGIDTGYNSVGIPLLSQIPGIMNIPAIGGDCHLRDELLAWLREVVKPHESDKATLLLSHNQYFSAFEEQYTKPAKQMADLFKGREVVWIWGHEHRFAIYDKFTPDGSITAYGRCIGHSGMPTDIKNPDKTRAPVRFYDARTHKLSDGSVVGENGYLLVTISGESLTLDYRDLQDTQVFWETFRPSSNGALDHRFEDKGILKSV